MNVEKEMKDFYAEIVESLKMEATGLKNKLEKCTSDNKFDMYIQLIKALRETMLLVKQYEWQLMYSEYDTLKYDDAGRMSGMKKQVAVWEQNCDNEIRNKKVWTVVNEKDGE